jgi:protein pelota
VLTMKILGKTTDKDSELWVSVQIEEGEDLWHLYNLVAKGDTVKAATQRKVSKSVTGSGGSERVTMSLSLVVESIHFDAVAGRMRISGRIVTGNQFVRHGQYHTVELLSGKTMSLKKKEWDSLDMERLDEASDPVRRADLGVVLLQEGLAHICLISPRLTLIRQKIELSIPRKRRAGEEAHTKKIRKFFDTVARGVVQHFDFEVVKCVLVGSPGFLRETFLSHLMEEARRKEWKSVLDNKDRFVLAQCSSGHTHVLPEILASPAIQSRISESKGVQEVRTLQKFFRILRTAPDKASYGPKHVQFAAENSAIETLMLTDELLRNVDIMKRKEYVALVEKVRVDGGNVILFSTMNVSGEQLRHLSGIAAILRFPLVLEDFESDDEDYLNISDSDDDGEAENVEGVEEDAFGVPVRSSGRRGKDRDEEGELPKDDEDWEWVSDVSLSGTEPDDELSDIDE